MMRMKLATFIMMSRPLLYASYNINVCTDVYKEQLFHLLIRESLNASAVLITSTKAWSSNRPASALWSTRAYLKAVWTWVVPCSKTAPVSVEKKTQEAKLGQWNQQAVKQASTLNPQQSIIWASHIRTHVTFEGICWDSDGFTAPFSLSKDC